MLKLLPIVLEYAKTLPTQQKRVVKWTSILALVAFFAANEYYGRPVDPEDIFNAILELME